MDAALEFLKSPSAWGPLLIVSGSVVIIAYRFRHITIQIGEKMKIILSRNEGEESER